uniref:Uncharacterized protein n=1 Tax=Chenopodium quinoa TaxID=63459 RepID=A0A803L433_CHEQI
MAALLVLQLLNILTAMKDDDLHRGFCLLHLPGLAQLSTPTKTGGHNTGDNINISVPANFHLTFLLDIGNSPPRWVQIGNKTDKDGGRIGSLLCNKAILSATTPTLCQRHALDAKRHISQALKKGGVSAALSNKAATKFHLVINEYVQLIQSKRRYIARTNKDNIAIENGGN